MSHDDLHLSAKGRAFIAQMKARIETGEVRHHDLTNMTDEERAASIAEGCAGDEAPMIPPLHSRVRFLRTIGEGSDPWQDEWAKAGDEGAIVQISPCPDPNAPARVYMIEIVTPTDDPMTPACRLVCCAARDVEVIWTPPDTE